MSEPTQTDTVAEATPAVKRQALKEAGFPVATRGKLSADAEAKYAELAAAGRAPV